MTTSKNSLYDEIAQQLEGLLTEETDRIANAANTAALLYSRIPDINWLGFYFLRARELVLGPFQGEPACIRIPVGRGVCGVAAETRESQVVPNVHEFADHIVCDTRANSELVVPVVVNGELIGVLDVDSPSFDRFDEQDRVGMERLAGIFADSLG